MHDIKPILSQAECLSPFVSTALIPLEVRTHGPSGQPGAQEDSDADNVLHVYGEVEDTALIKPFGALLERQFDESQASTWSGMQQMASPAFVDAYQAALKDSPAKDFSILASSFNSPLCRLTAIHLSNALIANGVSREDARNVDVRKHPATSAYAAGERPHSLIPLVSGYGNLEICRSFGAALEELCVNNCVNIVHSEIKKAFRDLVRRVLLCEDTSNDKPSR